ncbi:MAG: hypothetical protein R6U11_07265, partial [Bacteroidales bacterium]
LKDIDYSAEELRHEAARRATKMSIQGVQPKLSAILNVQQSKFDIVDVNGKYIIKPQHHIYPRFAKSGSKRTPIPDENGQAFRLKTDTCSGAKRTVIPV